jgi:acyl-CoA dehydrogenase
VTSERDDLIDAVNRTCDRHQQPAADGWDAALWAALENLGVTLLSVPEDNGGAGADHAMTAAVLATLAARAAAVPAAETLLAGGLLASAGQQVPAGPLSAALAGQELTMRPDGPGYVLTGTLTRVPWARHVPTVVVLGELSGRPAVASLDPRACMLQPGANLAGEPRDTLVLDAVQLSGALVAELPGPSDQAADGFALRAAAARVAQLSGAAQRALELSTAYTCERKQFGRPLRAFQAVQQHLAAMAGEVLLLQTAAAAAALAMDASADPGLAVTAAKTAAGPAVTAICAIAHQLHGAIGFTEEHPLHLVTTRLWAWREEYGSDHEWAARLAGRALAGNGGALWPMLTGSCPDTAVQGLSASPADGRRKPPVAMRALRGRAAPRRRRPDGPHQHRPRRCTGATAAGHSGHGHRHQPLRPRHVVRREPRAGL